MERRRALKLFAGAGLVALVGCGNGTRVDVRRFRSDEPSTTPTESTERPTRRQRPTGADASCSTIPEETAGPYPGDGSNGPNVLDRERHRAQRHPLELRLGVRRPPRACRSTIELTVVDTANGCAPLAGAAVYVWHCDRDGRYSMYSRGRHRRELPARRAGDRRQRSGDVHEHLPGRLLGPLAAHPLRGVPEPRRGDRGRRRRSPPRSSPCPRTSATRSTRPTATRQSVRNLSQTSLEPRQGLQRRRGASSWPP